MDEREERERCEAASREASRKLRGMETSAKTEREELEDTISQLQHHASFSGSQSSEISILRQQLQQQQIDFADLQHVCDTLFTALRGEQALAGVSIETFPIHVADNAY